jgi:hypothetical protein
VVLRPGDKFRVSGGPYWKKEDGTKIPMAYRGVCTFLRATRSGTRVYIEGRNKDGAVLLHVEGRRKNKVVPEIVCRPYKIRGKVRSKKR